MRKFILSIIALMMLPLYSQSTSAAALSTGATVAVVVGTAGTILAVGLIAVGDDDGDGNSNTNTSTTTTTSR
ncbi:hypothetical protein EDF78_11614 [Rahnella sp. BIGb0236]|uniref:hypothetical protein n=1 Tax=Rahnella sp. BIGb0236 TaxID=2485117 RepID=UPI00105E91C3|nr:hypothetical protein [Rahnella sp. BIGb0236]TDS86230.1 hypothetical protein EDF78_11614 [Rahnella sp. BIGb0236]